VIRTAVSLAISRRSRPEELLLVERSKTLRYFGGFLAFPGGTLDSDDATVPVEGLTKGALGPFVAAGARELFEETGMWLGRGGAAPSLEVLRDERRRLLAQEVSFADLLSRHRQHLDARDLTLLCRMTTPPFSPVRFDTAFLRGFVPEDAPIEIWDGELVSGDFVRPEETLALWRRGGASIAPPMIVLLQEWLRGQEGLVDRIREMTEAYERGKLHRIYFSPGILLVPLTTPTQPPATSTNTLVVGEERIYVVDPSPSDRREQERLFELVDDLLAEGRTLEGILLTHYHPDHVGALSEMQRRFPVPAQAHPDCMERLPGARFGRALEHGDEVDLGTAPDGTTAWKLRAYHVPGHAKGHLAFQESRYGAIAVGDLVSTLSSILVDPSDGHLATYLESLRFLEAVTEGMLYPGHGPPATDGRAVIRKTLEHRREREEQVLAALSNEPQSPRELLLKIYTDVDPKVYHLAERSLLSSLIKLEEERRVVRTEAGYRLASSEAAEGG
jgi:glyoxylase-like metal-dependent hydrolase (beta-lactamase superfamily II)/8-oxo-dGTP pyrophosphatase MutT (NUDIX family)